MYQKSYVSCLLLLTGRNDEECSVEIGFPLVEELELRDIKLIFLFFSTKYVINRRTNNRLVGPSDRTAFFYDIIYATSDSYCSAIL